MNEMQAFKVPRTLEYQGKRVLTTEQMAECYGVDKGRLTYNFSYNRDRFKEGVHFLCLEAEEKRAFLNLCEIHTGSKNAGKLYLWSERGVLLHAKSLNTDRAWEVYEKLVDLYFHVRQQSFHSASLKEGRVLASEVYSFLGLSNANYWQWVERNITGNRFAVEGLDYRYIGGEEFILAPSLVKCMCMMSKSDEGERCRQEYIRKLDEYDAVLSALGIRRKEHLSMDEMKQREHNPLVALDFAEVVLPIPAATSGHITGIADKRLLSMKEFCAYAGLGRNKAREYAEENNLIVHVGRRVLVDRVAFEQLCDDKG